MIYHYRAIKKNKIKTGTIEANHENEVVEYLRNNDFFPVKITAQGIDYNSNISLLFNHVTFTDIVDLTRQLAIMLNAGLTLIDSFNILKKQITKPSLVKIITEIDKEIRSGSTFSKSLQKYPHLFSNLYISLVKSGEASGKLSDILLKLADNLEKQREFQGKVKGALIYPVIIIIAMFLVMFIMITFVIPKLLDLYKDFGIELPMSTQMLIIISSFSAKFWPLIVLLIVGIVLMLKTYLKTKAGRFFFDSTILKMPVIGNVIRMSALVDSTRTLSILIGAGVSILDALSIIIETSNNLIYQTAFENIYKQVEKGTSLGNSMTNEGVFPPMLVQMTMVGEQTGHLDDTLMRISKYFEMESELAVKAMTTMIEPLVLVVLGLGVGFLVISVITPIYSLTASFK